MSPEGKRLGLCLFCCGRDSRGVRSVAVDGDPPGEPSVLMWKADVFGIFVAGTVGLSVRCQVSHFVAFS